MERDEVGLKEAVQRSIEGGVDSRYRADESVDHAYEALNEHRNVCRVCANEDGSVNPKECVVGGLLSEAWGWTEEYRDRLVSALDTKATK